MASKNNNTSSNFIKQAGILAMAGIIVRIIGILYRSPLVAIIGDKGNGYYNTAYVIYTIILLVSSYSIPSAISKVIAARLALGEHKNAHRLFIASFIYVTIMGTIGSLVCYFFADKLVGPGAAQVLRVFAPTIFLSGFLGTFRGYFQAYHTMVYTSVSQILEQILNAVVSIGAAYLFVRALSGQSESLVAIGGAKGSAIGTGMGVLTALIFMAIMYARHYKSFREARDRDNTERLLTPRQVAAVIIGMVTPVVLSTCIYNLSSASNLKIYQHIMIEVFGMGEEYATTNYGLFSGKAMQIVNIPIAVASAMSAAIIPSIAHSFERGQMDEVRDKIHRAVKVTMIIAVPSAAGLFVLAEPVTLLLYPQRASYMTVAALIRVLAVTVVFYCISTLSNAILQGTGYVNIPVVNAALSLIIQSMLLASLLLNTDLGLYALCIATICYSLLMLILNGFAIRFKLNYRQEFRRSMAGPILAALVMGIIAFVTNGLISDVIRSISGKPDMVITGMNNVILLTVCITVSVVIYFAMLIALKSVTVRELKGMILRK